MAGLVTAAAVLLVLFFLGAALPRDPAFDLFFGVEAYRLFGVAVLLLAFGALLATLLVPGLARGLAGGLSTAVGAIPRRLRTPLLLFGSGAAFWLVPDHKLSGDAVLVILRTSFGDVYASNPLTSFLTIGVSRALGWPAVDAIRLVSCACGVVYVYAAVRIARECFPAGPARGGFGVVLVCCGTSALFFGSIEVYAPLAAAIGLYLFLGIRALRRGTTIIGPSLLLGVAFGLHGSAGLLLPSLFHLANGCRLWPLRFRGLLRAGLAFLLPVFVVYGAVYLLAWGGEAPAEASDRYGSFLGGNGQGPLLPLRLTPVNVLHRYAVLDAEHLVGVLNLIVLAAPAGVLLLFLGRRPVREVAAWRFTAVAALFLVAFPFFWNVNYGLRQDWDLFSPMGIPLTLLGGLAFLGRGPGVRRAVGAAALSLFCFVPFVLSNLGDTWDRRVCMTGLYWTMRRAELNLPEEPGARREIAKRAREHYERQKAGYDPNGAEASTHEALLSRESGSPRTAELLFRQVLRNEPRNARAQEGLGSLLLALNRNEEARVHLRNALGEQNWRLSAWLDLARIAIREWDEEEAIRQLENGLRRGGLSDRAGEALHALAQLRSRRGDAEAAAALFDLAAEQGYSPGK